MRSWKHTGFSVDRSVRVHGADQAAVDKIMQYMELLYVADGEPHPYDATG